MGLIERIIDFCGRRRFFVLLGTALLAAWGLFIWLNRGAEELEPQAMEQVQREDEHIP